MHLDEIQKALRDEKLDGWLFFDHHERDPLAYRILGLQPGRTVTRRWYYLIPASGEPRESFTPSSPAFSLACPAISRSIRVGRRRPMG